MIETADTLHRDGRGMLLLPAVAVLMVTVGFVAAIGSARRAPAVQPTEALRAEG